MLFREDIHEREPPALDERVRNRLAAELLKLGLVVEQLELARPAGHEQVDHALGPGRKMAGPRRERVASASRGRAARSNLASGSQCCLPRRQRDRPPEAMTVRPHQAPRRSRRKNGAASFAARAAVKHFFGVSLRQS